jgi:hypothetical protein
MRLLPHIVCAFMFGAAAMTSAAAADLPIESSPNALQPLRGAQLVPSWENEVGARYWFSSGRTQIDFFGVPGIVTGQCSRLTYSNLQAQSAEIFGRVEHQSGFFIKGFAGGGAITSGNLQDEDFPPFIAPYSSTNSEQQDGRLTYAMADIGWTWKWQGTKLGFFTGYHYYREIVNAFGCTQTATNPFVCAPAIPNSVQVIAQTTNWQAIRFGFNGEWRFAGGWIFNADLAWIPYAWLNASDTHLLRADLGGPTSEDGGSFDKFELEALLGYRFTNGFSVGLGGRYWKIDTTAAQRQVLGLSQTISLVTKRWGAYLQASYKFYVLAD